jgi:primosomal protein N'
MLRGRHRHHLMVKASRIVPGFESAREVLRSFAESTARPRVSVDVDPASLL